MVADKNDLNNAPEASEEFTDEVKAALEELKQAQAKLDEARAKMESEKNTGESSQEESSAQVAEVLVAEVVETVTVDTPAVSCGAPVPPAPSAHEQNPHYTPVQPVGQQAPVQPTGQQVPSPSGQEAQAQQVPPAPGYQNQAQQVPPAPGYQNQAQQVPPPPGYQGYAQQAPPPPGYQAQGQPPHYQQPYAQASPAKDRVVAGLLAIFLGWLGIHKFYLGYNTSGFIMLAVTILGSIFTFGIAGGVMTVIGIIEGIVYLTKSQSEFESIYVYNKREWF